MNDIKSKPKDSPSYYMNQNRNYNNANNNMNNNNNNNAQKNEEKSEEYLKTRRGLPGKDAKFFKVPDEYINAIVGSNGETIKRIEIESNCKIEVGNAPIPNTKLRYVFIEGTEENYKIAKDLIEKVIGDYANKNANKNSS